jgi:site-specific recombinase XerD
MNKNKILSAIENKINTIVNNSIIKNETLTIDLFLKRYSDKLYGNTNFYAYVFNKIDTLYKNNELASESKRTFSSQITKLMQFRKELQFNELNESFIESYKKYMIEDLNNGLNTYNKSISMIKTFCNWAVKDGVLSENPLKRISTTNEAGKRDFLGSFEVNKLFDIYNAETLPKNKQNVLRYFLFACFTGLRYSDIKTLVYDDIKSLKIDGETVLFIDKKQHKVKNRVQVPIIPKAEKLIPKDKISEYQKVFKVYTNQPTNRYLKEIAAKAEINKTLSFHVARYSFGTMGLENNVSMEYISKMLGHSNLSITHRIYTKTSIEMKYKEIMKLENND